MELLAPAGSMEALQAAVKGGADAVYVGGTQFSARQYAKNFDNRQLEEATNFCHHLGVKIYATVNTLLSNNELKEAENFINQIYGMGVDGVIIQDLGLMRLIRQAFPDLKVHASTQMTVHNTLGVKALEKMGFKRVVLARELEIEEIAQIAAHTEIELEVFVHGALCICYSGQCLMSSLIGGRSGNRGKCAQPCRLIYTLMDKDGKRMKIQGKYLLSARDICTLNYLALFKKAGVTSLKIEGRMKKPEYVFHVTSAYRRAIDSLNEKAGYMQDDDMKRLMLAYNRGGFWPGYAFDGNKKTLIAPEKPDNWGLFIGKVKKYNGKTGRLVLELTEDISLGDGLEIWQDNGNTAGMYIRNIYINGKPVEGGKAGQTVELKTHKGLKRPRMVYKTFDKKLMGKMEDVNRSREIPIYCKAVIKMGRRPLLDLWDDQGNRVRVEGNLNAQAAINKPLTDETVRKQLSKTGGTAFNVAELDVELEDNVSLPVRELNGLRRMALDLLIKKRLGIDRRGSDISGSEAEDNVAHGFPWIKDLITEESPTGKETGQRIYEDIKLSLWTRSEEILKRVIKTPIDTVYFVYHPNINLDIVEGVRCRGKKVVLAFPPITRNKDMEDIKLSMAEYFDGVLVTNLGLLELFADLGVKMYGDFSLNVFNSLSVDQAAQLGLARITLSPELTARQIDDIIKNNGSMEYELIIHGYLPLMVTHWCPGIFLEQGDVSGKGCESGWCSRDYMLVDRMGQKLKIFPYTTGHYCINQILNSQCLSLMDRFERIKDLGARYLRINVTLEKPEEILEIIEIYHTLIGLDGQRGIPGHIKERMDRINARGFTRGRYFRGV